MDRPNSTLQSTMCIHHLHAICSTNNRTTWFEIFLLSFPQIALFAKNSNCGICKLHAIYGRIAEVWTQKTNCAARFHVNHIDPCINHAQSRNEHKKKMKWNGENHRKTVWLKWANCKLKANRLNRWHDVYLNWCAVIKQQLLLRAQIHARSDRNDHYMTVRCCVARINCKNVEWWIVWAVSWLSRATRKLFE